MKKLLIWLLLAELFPAVILILLLLSNLGTFSTGTLKALILITSTIYIAMIEIAVLVKLNQKPKTKVEVPKPVSLLELVFEPNFGGGKE